MKDRFEVVYKGNHSAGIVFVDKETGVNYLFAQMGYAGGLMPLLDADGKPVITQKTQEVIGPGTR